MYKIPKLSYKLDTKTRFLKLKNPFLDIVISTYNYDIKDKQNIDFLHDMVRV